MAVFRGFPAAGIVACYDEASGGGAVFDIDAPRNAPAKTPASHLDKLVWHPDLFQYEVVLETSVTVNHAALATTTVTVGSTGSIIGGGPSVGVYAHIVGDIRITDIPLASFSALATAPTAMIALSGRMLPSGFIVQTDANGGLREVAPWVTTSGVYLRETAVAGSVNLAATSLTYRVMVFRSRTADPAKPLWSGPSPLQLGRGIIDTSRKYAKQVAVGESPYSINMGPTLDCANGSVRSATGGITVSEPNYSGSLAAPAYRNIGL